MIMENWRKYLYMIERKEAEKAIEALEDSSEVAKIVLVDSQGRVLFLKRSNYLEKFAGEWDLPGGHLKVGEDLMAGLQREVEEETSLNILRARLYTKIDNVSFFEGIYEKGSIVLSNEHDDYRFIDPFEFENPDKFQKIAQEVVNNA